jgi:hypothetical protein
MLGLSSMGLNRRCIDRSLLATGPLARPGTAGPMDIAGPLHAMFFRTLLILMSYWKKKLQAGGSAHSWLQ